MEHRIRIAVIDDHPLFRQGVVATLAAEEDVLVVGEGATAADAVRLSAEALPDVIVLDINLPGDGIAALETIAREHPQICVLMLTVVADEERVTSALQRGARGYLLKGVSGAQLIDTVRIVHQGELYVAPSLAARLLTRGVAAAPAKSAEADRLSGLSGREREILQLVARGLSNKEVGLKLDLTEKTVKHYLTSVLRKLNVRNRVEAALLGSQHGRQPAIRIDEPRLMAETGETGVRPRWPVGYLGRA